MFRQLSRLFCFIISFQLFVGCNSAQLAVTGADDFHIRGLIAKTFERAGGFLFSSAVAAVTGKVEAWDYTIPAEPILIKTVELLDGATTFGMTIPKAEVENKIISLEYVKTGNTDSRQKLTDLEGHTDSVDVILDANATLRTAIIKAGLIADPTANVRDEINNFTWVGYEGVLKAISATDFAKTFVDSGSFAEIGALFLQNKGEGDPNAFKAEQDAIAQAAAAASKSGAKLACDGSEKPEILKTANFTAKLSFVTTDAKTISYFGASNDFGEFTNIVLVNKAINDFYDHLYQIIEDDDVVLKGTFNLVDIDNEITTSCVIIQD